MTTAPGAQFWTLRLLEFQGNQRGYGEIIALGSGDRTVQTSLSQVPGGLILDQLYIHGDPVIGQKRGIALNSGNRSDFVAIAPDKLAPGHRIEAKDLSRGDLAGATGLQE